jgi:hypothetical protein
MPKTDSVRVSPDVRETTMEWWREYFPNNNNAAGWALEEVPHLIRHTLAEMRGTFTRGELWMILDVMNGHAMNTFGQWATAGRHINISIQDSFALYPGMYEEKWGVDKDLIDKLLNLSRWQCACLEIWVSGFWHHTSAPEKFDGEAYVMELAAKEGKK